MNIKRILIMNKHLKFKGGMTTITNIIVQSSLLEKIKEEIESFQGKAPALLNGMPVVIDFCDIEITHDFVAELIKLIKSVGAIPFGLKGKAEHLEPIAKLCELAYLGKGQKNVVKTTELDADKIQSVDSEKMESNPIEIEPAINRTKIVHGPIRGGQQIHARNADLIIIGNVNNSAEVLADGNVHVYGTLKGRAMAGLRGDDDAKIFVSSFDPEMVVINGDYMVKDSISPNVIGQPVMISKEDEKIIINKVSN
jgi:septum site-determining protein MinC